MDDEDEQVYAQLTSAQINLSLHLSTHYQQ